MKVSSAAIIGLGSIGTRHARNLQSLYPDLDLIVQRRNSEIDDKVMEFDADVVTSTEALIHKKPDFIIVATPSAKHIDYLPPLIESGIPLLVEKPIVTTISDCTHVLQTLKSAPEAIRISGFNFRYLRSLQKTKELVQSGSLGRLVRVQLEAGQWLGDWRQGDHMSYYSAHEEQGGGVELDLVHEIDVLRWMIGDVELIAAKGNRLSSLNLNSNDVSVGIFENKDGVLATISLDYVSRRRVRRYEFVGEKASLFWEIDGVLELVHKEGSESQVGSSSEFDVSESYVEMLKQFVEAIHSHSTDFIQPLESGIASTLLAVQMRGLEH